MTWYKLCLISFVCMVTCNGYAQMSMQQQLEKEYPQWAEKMREHERENPHWGELARQRDIELHNEHIRQEKEKSILERDSYSCPDFRCSTFIMDCPICGRLIDIGAGEVREVSVSGEPTKTVIIKKTVLDKLDAIPTWQLDLFVLCLVATAMFGCLVAWPWIYKAWRWLKEKR